MGTRDAPQRFAHVRIGGRIGEPLEQVPLRQRRQAQRQSARIEFLRVAQ